MGQKPFWRLVLPVYRIHRIMQYNLAKQVEKGFTFDYLLFAVIFLILGLFFPFNMGLFYALLVISFATLLFGIALENPKILLLSIICIFFAAGMLRSLHTTTLFPVPEIPQIQHAAKQLSTTIHSIFPATESEILDAMLIGKTESLTWETKNQLNRTGLRHVTAISGMHVATIYFLIVLLFIGLGFWRGQALIFATILLFFYILLIGAPPSATRAFIMGFFVIVAELLGRPGNSTRFLLFAAGIMLFYNPELFWNIGFQLSFSAVLGIIHLSPIIEEFMKRITNFQGLAALIGVSVSAQIAVTPLLLFYFGEASVIGVVLNILIVPLLPFLLVSSFVALIFGLIDPLIGLIISPPAQLLLSGLITVLTHASKLPFSTVVLPQFSWIWLIPYYIALSLIIRHTRNETLIKRRDA